MIQKNTNKLLQICHPYMFALKEGHGIREDLMDYSLLLVHKNCYEVIKRQPASLKCNAIPIKGLKLKQKKVTRKSPLK